MTTLLRKWDGWSEVLGLARLTLRVPPFVGLFFPLEFAKTLAPSSTSSRHSTMRCRLVGLYTDHFNKMAPVRVGSLILLFALSLLSNAVCAATFVVKDIRLEGLQRISAGTIFTYLPVKVGDTLDDRRTADAIRALYRTGFFSDVRLERDGGTLVVVVVERPSIASIEFSGNDSIETEDLLESLKQVGFDVGRVFNRSLFDQVEQELRRSYFSEGKYGVQIESTITPLERNRVGVNFDISEGAVAKIRKINIVGNEVFDDDDLLDEFNLRTPRWYAFFSKRDEYSRQKLAADLETLRSFYLDRGFVNFNIDSTQVSITPDKRDIYITINIAEGSKFTINDIKLAGDLIVPKEELFELVTVKRGDVFSRKEVTVTSTKLGERLGEEGYAFANVNAVPDIQTDKDQVALTFFVDPGKRVYVRRITFSGNNKTQDIVLRREMRQIEGAWVSTSAIERSKERLDRLGYFDEVNVETPTVPGTTDQVDVDVSVVERPSGNLSAGLGFAQTQGIIVQASVAQENFLGTGNRINLTFNNSKVDRQFRLGYLNPYYTADGISRGFEAFFKDTNADKANVSDYSTNEAGASVNFGIPLNEFDKLRFSLGGEWTDLSIGNSPSREVLEFADEEGTTFYDAVLTASWSNDTRNKRVFADRGRLARLASEVSVGDLSYYKLDLEYQQFIPLVKFFPLVLAGEVGYGDGFAGTSDLPLIDNYFAGGVRSVRGYEANTLGPRDSRGDPLGGRLKTVARAELILPVHVVTDVESFRVTSFFDAGTVFGPNDDFKVSDLRTSTGVAATWLSPLGAMTFSIALPLNDDSDDDTQPFQFTFGTSF